jgi:hypothetical protein
MFLSVGMAACMAPDSDTVPDFVKTPLTAEGFDVKGFRPQTPSAEDIAAPIGPL